MSYKNVILFLILTILLLSCYSTKRTGMWRDRIYPQYGNSEIGLLIKNDKDIDECMKLDSNQKLGIRFVQINFDTAQEVTDFLFEFPNIEMINIFNCYGFNLSRNNTSIKSLIIMDNRTIINNLEQLGNIEDILYFCGLDDNVNFGNFSKFKKLRHLKKLELFLFDINIIDRNITSLDSLEILSLRQTAFTEIPKSICNLKNLKELTIESEYKIKVPKCIIEMKSLRVLNIIGNREYVEKFNKKYKNKYPNLQVNAIL